MTTKPKKSKAPSSKEELPPALDKLLNPKKYDIIKTIGVESSGKFFEESELQSLYSKSSGIPSVRLQIDELLNDFTYVGADTALFVRQDQPFPMAIRAMKWEANSCYILFEQAPSMRNIFWSPTNADEVSEDTVNSYSLPFPWTQFLIKLDISYNLFEDVKPSKKLLPGQTNHPSIKNITVEDIKFSTHSLVPSFRNSIQLYRPPLPNTYEHGAMCFVHGYTNKDNPSIVEALEKFVEEFYSTTFNSDLSLEFDLFGDTKFKGKSFSELFTQWSKYDLTDMIDPEKIPFAAISSEKGFWESHKMFSAQYSALHETRRIGNNGLDLSGTTVSHYDASAKRTKILLKDHDDARSTIETFETMDVAVKSLFNRTPRPPFLDSTSYNGARRSIMLASKDKEDAKKTAPAKILTFFHQDKDKMIVHKAQSRTYERPSKQKDFYQDSGAQPSYKFVIDKNKFKESISMLRKELQTGPLPLPPGLRYWNPSEHVLAFERPPAMKTVAFLPTSKEAATNDTSERQSYKIFVPWTQYWVSYNTKLAIQTVYATCSSVPMSHKDWTAGVLPLPNMYYESKVCTPNVIAPSSSIGEIMLSAYNSVWGSNYNMDLLDAVSLFIDNCMHNRFNSSAERELAEKLWKGHRKGSVGGLFEAWSTHPNPNDLLKVIPSCSPRSNYAQFSGEDFMCECDAADPEYEGEDIECECVPPDGKQLPIKMSSMIKAAMDGASRSGWLKVKLSALDGSIFSIYDGLLLHAQAHEKKMTY